MIGGKLKERLLYTIDWMKFHAPLPILNTHAWPPCSDAPCLTLTNASRPRPAICHTAPSHQAPNPSIPSTVTHACEYSSALKHWGGSNEMASCPNLPSRQTIPEHHPHPAAVCAMLSTKGP